MPHPALPVGDCLSQAFQLTLRKPLPVLRAFWPLFCAEAAGALLTGSPWRLAPLLIALLLAIPCACAWHRHLIDRAPPQLALGWPEWRYLKRAALITVVLTVTLLPFAVGMTLVQQHSPVLATALVVLGVALATWVTAPGMMTLSAAALNRDLPTEQIKALSLSNRSRLFTLLFGTTAAEVLLSMAADQMGQTPAAALAHLTVSVLFWPVAVAVISVAYIWLIDTARTETTP